MMKNVRRSFLKKVAKEEGASSNSKNNKIIRCHIASILTASDVSCTHTLILSKSTQWKTSLWMILVSDSDWLWHKNLHYNVEVSAPKSLSPCLHATQTWKWWRWRAARTRFFNSRLCSSIIKLMTSFYHKFHVVLIHSNLMDSF